MLRGRGPPREGMTCCNGCGRSLAPLHTPEPHTFTTRYLRHPRASPLHPDYQILALPPKETWPHPCLMSPLSLPENSIIPAI